jgi:hypothetical protein
MREILFALLLPGTAFVAALATWPARALGATARATLLAIVGAALLSLTISFPRSPVALKAVVTLSCVILTAKLLDLHVDAAGWRGRRLRQWVGFLVNPLVLVYRVHLLQPARPRAASARLLARGIVEISAGAALLWWAFHSDLSRYGFWVEHTVKLVGAYLCVFDGTFVAVTGALRLLGCHVIDHSRDPAFAVSPADFWRRYNRDAGLFLYEDVFKPLGGMRSPRWGIVWVFLVNGLLHEYIAWAMIGRVMGYQVAFFLLHGIAVAATFRWRPRGVSAVAGWLATVVFLVASSVLFFGSINQILGWYSGGGLLPG